MHGADMELSTDLHLGAKPKLPSRHSLCSINTPELKVFSFDIQKHSITHISCPASAAVARDGLVRVWTPKVCEEGGWNVDKWAGYENNYQNRMSR